MTNEIETKFKLGESVFYFLYPYSSNFPAIEKGEIYRIEICNDGVIEYKIDTEKLPERSLFKTQEEAVIALEIRLKRQLTNNLSEIDRKYKNKFLKVDVNNPQGGDE